MTRLMWIVGALAAFYVIVCLIVFLAQSKLVWFPGPRTSGTPRDVGLTFDELEITVADGVTIHAWHLRARERKGAVILCHGNAGNIESRVDKAAPLVAAGFDVLLFDYRGYGASDGSPSEEGTYLDAEAAWSHLIADGLAPERIAVFGESLGGAVAIELVRRRKVAAVIVEDTFTSLADMAAEVYPWLPVRLLVRIDYASIDKVPSLATPLLVIHSPADELVPFEQGVRLFDAAREPKQFLETAGAHNGRGFLARPEWTSAVCAFLELHTKPR